ncbi:hypothetical protein PIROE2DRAFT_5133 [Piromyces sp. E2]|nr:hypothetical protein PIROE2DRAFT_5133 [Piromyces sp. E2]|eukprot:OUM67388.1 hypothetical protein PIROE2DRAFT_5133 [Piromyces sp. E2]
MKFLTLFTSVLLILSVLHSCEAFSLRISSIKQLFNQKIKSIPVPTPIKNYINEKEDDVRDNKNYHNEINIERDILYNGNRKLDVYYNKLNIISKKKLKPVYIFIYGGSWYSGSKVKFTKFGSLLEENDYIAVLPDYVLFPHGGFDDMVDDIFRAIQWTFSNIQRYGGDPNRVSIAAYSAGAHLTTLTLFKSLLAYPNNKINLPRFPLLEKVVLLNGPYDFDDYSVINKFLGKEMENSIVENIAKVIFKSKNISPTDLFKSFPNNSLSSLGAKKFVFFYTSNDTQVKESSALHLMDQMKRVCPKVNIQYVYKQGYEHTTLTRGVRAGSVKEENVFMSLVHL